MFKELVTDHTKLSANCGSSSYQVTLPRLGAQSNLWGFLDQKTTEVGKVVVSSTKGGARGSWLASKLHINKRYVFYIISNLLFLLLILVDVINQN